MLGVHKYWLLLWIFTTLTNYAFSQESNLRSVKIPARFDTIQLDSLTILSEEFYVFCNNQMMEKNSYYLNGLSKKFCLKESCADSIEIRYRVFGLDITKSYYRKDTSIIFNRIGKVDDYIFSYNYPKDDFFGGSGIQKSGSISRGIAFGNSQDLSINSTLNLQLSGDLSPNMKLLASLTDDNIPIQPDGNTNKLQEFDQVFIQLYGNQYKLIAGDFWLRKPKGHFLNYNKRAQGIFGQYEWQNNSGKWEVQAAGALSKGKFARNIIQGIESNQGPYRLVGNENEPFIVVLGGSENVYLDGRLLERGQEYDYSINYNSSEITFTTRNPITKDSRIVVEFQYSDQNYARSLFQSSNHYQSDRLDFWFNMYSEQDAKNQSLQQDLSLAQRQLLIGIGDSLDLARTNSIDSIGFTDAQVTYKLVDSLGFDSILVYSVSPDSAFFRAVFTNVGAGNGNYVFDRFTAVGKVYKWIEPINNMPQGEFEPARLIVTPKRKSMITAGVQYKFSDHISVINEFSTSNNDINTFSRLDQNDNNAFGSNTKLIGAWKLGRNENSKWQIISENEIEFRSINFSPIQRYRSVEFDRDWNIRDKNFTGQELLINSEVKLKNSQFGDFGITGQNFSKGSDYNGSRARFFGNWLKNGWLSKWEGSYLSSSALSKNDYLRHISEFSKNFKNIKIGFKDDHEMNRFYASSTETVLQTNSYQWYDWQVFMNPSDSVQNGFKAFYRERYDRRSDSMNLMPAAQARTVGGGFDWNNNTNSKLKTLVSYRRLEIRDSSLINQTPENTLLGRIDYNLELWKGAFSSSTFYETGSGLELKKEFLYIEVNSGQGVYTWIDYNSDGVKDLNEFEIAQYVDQANYIRIFTPSNEYLKTYSNEFNQSLNLRPERLWAREIGLKKFISRFSNQLRYRMAVKTIDNQVSNYYPLRIAVEDTSLISSSTTLRNSFYFNRTSPIFGADFTFSELGSKILLSSGFDSRENRFRQLNLRWNIKQKFTLISSGETGTKKSIASYTSGRDYHIAYWKIKPEFIFQPNTVLRLASKFRWEEKQNAIELGGQKATIKDLGIEFKYNQLSKGSFQGGLNAVMISFEGIQNNALAFELLESLKPGINYTWNLSYQRSVSKNLQLSIQYNGRKSEQKNAIHAGGVEVRAFF